MTALGLLVAVVVVALAAVTLSAAALLAAIGETLGRGLEELGRELPIRWAARLTRAQPRIAQPSRG